MLPTRPTTPNARRIRARGVGGINDTVRARVSSNKQTPAFSFEFLFLFPFVPSLLSCQSSFVFFK